LQKSDGASDYILNVFVKKVYEEIFFMHDTGMVVSGHKLLAGIAGILLSFGEKSRMILLNFGYFSNMPLKYVSNFG